MGPRDGLQNEPGILPLATRVAFIRALAEAGLRTIEAASFVRPDRIPQMADAEGLFAELGPEAQGSGRRYVALVPNAKGLDRALAAGVTSIALFSAASETFNRRNINRPTVYMPLKISRPEILVSP